jgi:hypothetical protein
VLAILIGLTLAGCYSPQVRFIQGIWERGNVHFVDQWRFERGTFAHYNSIDNINPYTQAGQYQVIEVQEDSILLELFDLETSFGEERQQIRILIDQEADTIRISGQTFERILSP